MTSENHCIVVAKDHCKSSTSKPDNNLVGLRFKRKRWGKIQLTH